MANVKDILIEARVPFDWMNDLTDDEAACFARWLMSPSTGLRFSYRDERFFDNAGGGRTSTSVLVIEGQEAIRSSVITFWSEALSRVGLTCSQELVRSTDEGIAWPMGVLRVSEYDVENHMAVR